MPMYNVEKYVGACLESILNQTFQDFEVVVVDNGSTDNSAAVLESYVPRFGGRLKTSRIEKNSGGPSPAYNKAVALSRGKYVFVMDSDDLLMNNALEILYNFAEKNDADVVNMDRSYVFVSDTEKPFHTQENLRLNLWSKRVVDKAAFEPDDIGERVKNICGGFMGRTAWQKFVRRDLLMENNITFPENARIAHDTVWAAEVFCCARKILTISAPLYIYREVASSISHSKKPPQESIPSSMKSTLYVLNHVDKFLAGQKFFQENPQYHWALLNYFERICFGDLIYLTQDSALPAEPEFFGILKPEMANTLGEYGATLVYLLTASNFARSRLLMASQRVAELENKLKQIQGG